MQLKIVCGEFHGKAKRPYHRRHYHPITLPYSHILNGWVMPDGSVITNPIKAQNEAERLNSTITIH
ncbi:DUF1317 family protein [Pantoea vagans]|uniref:DUF1317 family protein n=1 Tax=Pantoea vagans TaxID=470934 RepID=UPI001F457CCB|nr:DUF1317 family protein [Pantoea vagans]